MKDYKERQQKLELIRSELGVDTLLLYSSRSDSRYSKWATGLTGSSTHHYLMLSPASELSFVEVCYRANDLRQNSNLPVLEVDEENCYGEFFKQHLNSSHAVGLVGNAPAIHFLELNSKLIDCTKQVDCLLMHKNVLEIEKIKQLTKLIDQGLTTSVEMLSEKSAVSEKSFANTLAQALLPSIDSPAFPTSILSGNRLRQGTVGKPTGKIIGKEDALLVDVGVVVDGLYADLTRMFFQQPSNLNDAYLALQELIHESVGKMKIGMTFSAVIDLIKNLAIEKGLPANTLVVRDLGHGIGFGLHEVPFLGLEQWNSQCLELGLLFCLEPELIVDGSYIRIEEMLFCEKDKVSIISN